MTLTTTTLGKIVDDSHGTIRTGPFGSQLHESDYKDEGVPVVMPKDIVDGHVDETDIARIGEEDVERLSQHQLLAGDIVYGRRGDIGRRALISDSQQGWLCGTGCLRISLGEASVDPTFLYYYLGQPRITAWMYGQAIGATMPNLNTEILRSVEVVYPPLPQQHQIASILSTFDELIRKNARRIKILEEMAGLIYREWFIHYRFPNHEKVKMVDSGTDRGEVPEGWEAKKLGDVIELAYGKALKEDDRHEGKVAVYGSSGMVGSHNEALIAAPGIVVGRKGNVGSVHWVTQDFWPIDTTFYVKTNLPLHFCFFALKHQHFISGDVAVPGLNRSHAYRNDFLVPSEKLLNAFTDLIAPMFKKIEILNKKNDLLRLCRDLLLPKLISGQLAVA